MLQQRELLDRYEGRCIVITGARGFVGSNLAQCLATVDCRVVRVLRPGAAPGPADDSDRFMDVHGDIRTAALWERVLPSADFVFHLAAQTSVAVAAADPAADYEANVLPALRLLEACAPLERKPVVLLAGTVTQAGLTARLPVDESQPDVPATIYDLHKLLAEGYMKFYAGRNAVRGASLRLANVYGPGPESARQDRGVVNRMIRRALAGKDVTVFGSADFVRDYIHVEDVVTAFLAAGLNIDALNGRHFVIGTGRGHTVAQALTLVAERAALKLGRKIVVRQVDPTEPLPAIETRNFIADSSAFARATGWSPRHELRQGIDRTIEACSCAS